MTRSSSGIDDYIDWDEYARQYRDLLALREAERGRSARVRHAGGAPYAASRRPNVAIAGWRRYSQTVGEVKSCICDRRERSAEHQVQSAAYMCELTIAREVHTSSFILPTSVIGVSMRIVINHLTRMHGGREHQAGVDLDSRRHVRRTSTASCCCYCCRGTMGRSRWRGSRPRLAAADARAAARRRLRFRARLREKIRRACPKEFWRLLDEIAQPTLAGIFGDCLRPAGTGTYAAEVGTGKVSLGCLRLPTPGELFYKDNHHGGRRLRMKFSDGRLRVEASVTDLRFRRRSRHAQLSRRSSREPSSRLFPRRDSLRRPHPPVQPRPEPAGTALAASQQPAFRRRSAVDDVMLLKVSSAIVILLAGKQRIFPNLLIQEFRRRRASEILDRVVQRREARKCIIAQMIRKILVRFVQRVDFRRQLP